MSATLGIARVSEQALLLAINVLIHLGTVIPTSWPRDGDLVAPDGSEPDCNYPREAAV